MAQIRNHFGNTYCYLMVALLAVFIVSGVEVPYALALFVDTIIGKIVVVICALVLFNAHPVIGALGLVAAYELIKRSEHQVGKPQGTHKYIPSENKKTQHLTALNQFPITVEEQVIAKQIPYTFNQVATASATYKPVQDNLHDATKLG